MIGVPRGDRLIGIVQATPSGTQFRIPARLRFPLTERLQAGATLSVLIFNPSGNEPVRAKRICSDSRPVRPDSTRRGDALHAVCRCICGSEREDLEPQSVKRGRRQYHHNLRIRLRIDASRHHPGTLRSPPLLYQEGILRDSVAASARRLLNQPKVDRAVAHAERVVADIHEMRGGPSA